MKTTLLGCALVLVSSASAFAQTTTVVAVREIVYVRDTVIVQTTGVAKPTRTTSSASGHTNGDVVNWNGGTIRYVKGTSREAGRQNFHWQK